MFTRFLKGPSGIKSIYSVPGRSIRNQECLLGSWKAHQESGVSTRFLEGLSGTRSVQWVLGRSTRNQERPLGTIRQLGTTRLQLLSLEPEVVPIIVALSLVSRIEISGRLSLRQWQLTNSLKRSSQQSSILCSSLGYNLSRACYF